MLDAIRDALRGEEGAGTGATFMRGLTLGALIGAAVAGSAIWQRRGRLRLARRSAGAEIQQQPAEAPMTDAPVGVEEAAQG
jgi:hypothetical protein